MVETRMDAAISRAVSPAADNRTSRAAGGEKFEVKLPEKPTGVEADVARIFAKRAFQVGSVEKTSTPIAPAGASRGQKLNIRV